MKRRYVPCPRCGGDGRVGFGAVCQTCSGRGELPTHDPIADAVEDLLRETERPGPDRWPGRRRR